MKKLNINQIYILMGIVLLAFWFLSGSELKADEPDRISKEDEIILVNIDDKATISLNEFIRRAEYTIRPSYCKQNKYLQKKIILNSLIAEKLFALEAAKNPQIANNPHLQTYLQGRREQSMRQWMRHIEAVSKVHLDSAKTQKYYLNAGREYDMQYFFVNDTAGLSFTSESDSLNSLHFEKYCSEHLIADSLIPVRKIKWGAQESAGITRAVFSEAKTKGEVIGPVQTGKDEFIVMRVKGWTDERVITDNQIRDRLRSVTETLTQFDAAKIWRDVVGEIMKGKTIEFNGQVSNKVCELFLDKFFKTDSEKKEILKQKVFDQELGEKEMINSMLDNDLLSQPFFTVNGKTWTVDDFRKEMMTRPIVFRKLRIPTHEFKEQFKLAMVDLVEDHFVTKVAYEKGYDEVSVVKRNENMWRDSFLAMYYKGDVLKITGETRNFGKDALKIIEDKLNPFVESLLKKYNKRIRIDFAEFEKISLASIDLYVKQPGQPYKSVVPAFPIITTNHYLGFADKIDE